VIEKGFLIILSKQENKSNKKMDAKMPLIY